MPIPPDDAGKEEVIAALVANVDAMIKADRKITALKELQVVKPNVAGFIFLLNSYHWYCWQLAMQGHIWQTGYQNNELEGIVFDDVPEALEKWHALGIKVVFADSQLYTSLWLLVNFLNDCC